MTRTVNVARGIQPLDAPQAASPAQRGGLCARPAGRCDSRVPDDRRSTEDAWRVWCILLLGFCSAGSLTAPALPHYADFMNLHVPPELEAKLDRLAAATGRRPDQLALDLLATSVDHDDWFREEVEKGRESARAGRLLDHDEVGIPDQPAIRRLMLVRWTAEAADDLERICTTSPKVARVRRGELRRSSSTVSAD